MIIQQHPQPPPTYRDEEDEFSDVPASSINSQFCDQPWSDNTKKKLDINEEAIDGRKIRSKTESTLQTTTSTATTTTPCREIDLLSEEEEEDDDDWILTDPTSSTSKLGLAEQIQKAMDVMRKEVARHAKIIGVGEMRYGIVEQGKVASKAVGRKWEEMKEKWDQRRGFVTGLEKAEGVVGKRAEE